MYEFLEVNRSKFWPQLKRAIILFLVLWPILFLYLYTKGEIIDWNILFLMYLGVLIPLTVLATFFGAMQDWFEFNKCKKILAEEAFNQLKYNGFKYSYTNTTSSWITSMPTLIGNIDGYPLRVEVERGVLRILADVNKDQLEKRHMAKLKEIFGKINVSYDSFGVALIYRKLRRKDLLYSSIDKDIKQLVNFFKTEKIDSWDIGSLD